MRRILASLLACAALSAACVTAEEKKSETSDRALVTNFLKENVIGKTVASPKETTKMDEGRMESDAEDQTTFNNFTGSAQGFGFDMTVANKETRYEMGKDGKRILPGRDLSGIEVYRYEIIERVSTKKLTGSVRFLSMTTKVPSRAGASILVTGVKVADGKLTWNETLPGYLDLISSGGKYKPGSWDGKYTFSLEGGKLRFRAEYMNFDVDPDTLKRTPTKDKLPPFVSKEVEKDR